MQYAFIHFHILNDFFGIFSMVILSTRHLKTAARSTCHVPEHSVLLAANNHTRATWAHLGFAWRIVRPVDKGLQASLFPSWLKWWESKTYFFAFLAIPEYIVRIAFFGLGIARVVKPFRATMRWKSARNCSLLSSWKEKDLRHQIKSERLTNAAFLPFFSFPSTVGLRFTFFYAQSHDFFDFKGAQVKKFPLDRSSQQIDFWRLINAAA